MPNAARGRWGKWIARGAMLAMVGALWGARAGGSAFALTAGITTPGTTDYPNGGLGMIDYWNDGRVSCGFIDEARGFAYFGTSQNYSGTFGANLIRVELGTFKRVGTLNFGDKYYEARSAGWDPVAGEACMLLADSWRNAAKLAKVDTVSFRVTDELALSGKEAQAYHVAMNPAARRAYLIYNDSDSGVSTLREIDMETFERGRAMQFAGGGWFVPSSVIDAEGKFGYFQNTWGLLKIDLESLTVAGILPPPTGGIGLGLLDPTANMAYLASGNRITRLDLATFSYFGSTMLQPGQSVTSGAIDPVRGAAYFGTNSNSDGMRIVKVDLAKFEQEAAIAIPGEGTLDAALFDMARGVAIFGSGYGESSLLQVASSPLALMDTIMLNRHYSAPFYSPISDPERDAIYFTTQLIGGDALVKIDAASGNQAAELAIPYWASCGALDEAGDAAYFAGGDSVFKVNLAPLQLAGALPLAADVDQAACAGVDPVTNSLFLGNYDGKVVRVGLGGFSITGTLTLEAGEEEITCGAVDPATRAAYYCVTTTPPSVVKVNLDTFTRVGSTPVGVEATKPIGIGLDGAGNASIMDQWVKIHRIGLAGFQSAETVDMYSAFGDLPPLIVPFAIDAAHGTLYSGWWGSFGSVAMKIGLNPIDAQGSAALLGARSGTPQAIFNQAVDSARRTVYYNSALSPVIRAREGEGLRGRMHSTGVGLPTGADIQLMRFHSHKAAGHVRLAIYDYNDPPKLLWESPEIENRAEGADIIVPISAGEPGALSLPAGGYRLAWQVDTNEAVASLANAAGGDFSAPLAFGPYPKTVETLPFSAMASGQWVISMDYEAAALTPSPTPSPSPTPFNGATPTGSLTPTWTQEPSFTPQSSPTPWVSPTPSATPGAPVFVLHPAGLSVNAGAGFAFEALATASGPIDYAWVKDGASVPGAEGPTLHVSNAAAADAGWYQCAAKTLGGRTLSEAAELKVVDPPAANAAAFGGSSGPAVSAPGADYYMGIVFVNTSPLSWTAAQGYRLKVIDDAGGLFGGAASLEVPSGTPVIAGGGGIATFIARIHAPGSTGLYSAHIQMFQSGAGAFGELGEIALEVAPPPNGARDWGTYE